MWCNEKYSQRHWNPGFQESKLNAPFPVSWESAFEGLGLHECWSVFNNPLSDAQEQTILAAPVEAQAQKTSLAEQETPLTA